MIHREKWLGLKEKLPNHMKRRASGKNMIAYAKHRAKRDSLVCELEFSDGQALLNEAGDSCPICAVRFDPNVVMKRASLDRLDPKMGYVLDNVMVICFRCNTIKRDIPLNILPEELERRAENWRVIRGS